MGGFALGSPTLPYRLLLLRERMGKARTDSSIPLPTTLKLDWCWGKLCRKKNMGRWVGWPSHLYTYPVMNSSGTPYLWESDGGTRGLTHFAGWLRASSKLTENARWETKGSSKHSCFSISRLKRIGSFSSHYGDLSISTDKLGRAGGWGEGIL